MLRRWIIYLLTLFLTVIFYGIYEGYISYLILLLTLFFPLFSLIISLYGMLRVRISLEQFPFELKKGEEQSAVIYIISRCKLPVSLVTMKMSEKNKTINGEIVKTNIFLADCMNSYVTVPLYTKHIGCIDLELKKIRVYDYLGLFCFPVIIKPKSRIVYILPDFICPDPVPVLPKDKIGGKGLKPKPGGGFAEDYDLRNYRTGDPLNSIHWKLSSKLDELIVREPLVSEKGKIFICFNLFGTAEEMDNVFGQIFYISYILLKRMIEFNICWYDADEELQTLQINDKNDFYRFISVSYSKPIKNTGRSIDKSVLKKADWYYIVRPSISEVDNEKNS